MKSGCWLSCAPLFWVKEGAGILGQEDRVFRVIIKMPLMGKLAGGLRGGVRPLCETQLEGAPRRRGGGGGGSLGEDALIHALEEGRGGTSREVSWGSEGWGEASV